MSAPFVSSRALWPLHAERVSLFAWKASVRRGRGRGAKRAREDAGHSISDTPTFGPGGRHRRDASVKRRRSLSWRRTAASGAWDVVLKRKRPQCHQTVRWTGAVATSSTP